MPFFNSRKSRSVRLLGLIAAALLFAATAPVDLRADTTLDSGTTTVTTGTDFGSTLIVGSSGTAALEVLVGGSAANGNCYLGYNAGSNGTVTVAGGTWANGGAPFIGYDGFGTLNLDSGLVTSNGFIVGYGTASYGIATVSSGRWENNGNLFVGYFGAGDLVVNGGSVFGGGGGSFIAHINRSHGSLTVSSGTWDSLDLAVGAQGHGSLIVNGGYVTSFYGTDLGGSGEATGTAIMSSGTWATNGYLYIGRSGTGVLNLSGGSVTSGSAFLGAVANSPSSNGLAVVTGGTWTNSGDLYVGVDDFASSTGTLAMSGGLVTVGGLLSKGSLGTINLNSGGTLQIGVGGTTGVLGVSTLTNNGTLVFDRSDASTYSGVLSGSGAVTKQGVGQLTFDGANSYSGLTTISGGTLALSGSGSIGTGGLSLGTGGVFDITALTSGTYLLPATGNLTGAGTLEGNGHTLAVLGSFLPGNSTGTVTVGAGLTLDLTNSGSSTFQIADPAYTAGTFDLVNGDGSVIFGGVLNLNFNGGTYADGTDVLRLFTNTGGLSGGFSAVNYTGLSAGQSATFNPATGFISLVPEPSAFVSLAAGFVFACWRVARRRS